MPLSTTCVSGGWGSRFNGDFQCLAGADTTTVGGPGALIRGGFFADGAVAGVFAVRGLFPPSTSGGGVGFRCAR